MSNYIFIAMWKTVYIESKDYGYIWQIPTLADPGAGKGVNVHPNVLSPCRQINHDTFFASPLFSLDPPCPLRMYNQTRCFSLSPGPTYYFPANISFGHVDFHRRKQNGCIPVKVSNQGPRSLVLPISHESVRVVTYTINICFVLGFR